MGFSLVFALLGLFQLTTAACSKTCSFDNITPNQNLTWCSCYGGFFCARLDVPLDYQNPSVGRASIPIIKYPAQANSSYGPYQGMILVNPGGPGSSGVDEARYNGSLLQTVVGSNWDIVGFDTRGIWLSEPLANCSASVTSAQSTKLRSRYVPRVSDDFYNSWIESGKELGEQCMETIGGEDAAGPHMSTATTARDMLSIVDAFANTSDGEVSAKPSHLLNYYGISYGTFLGQTFASMFPDRVGNVVLDGVVSPEGYLANYFSASVTHLDGIIAAFFIYCYEAGPSECSFYTGSTPKDIYDRFNQSFVQLDPQKAEANGWSNATDLESALLVLKVGLLTAADTPLSGFSVLPDVLLSLESAIATQNISSWTEQATAIYGDPTPNGNEHSEYTLGVLCSDQDNVWYNSTLENLKTQLEPINNQSIIGDVWSKAMLGCLGWSIKATEIFTGPFGGDTATPILFVSNTYDSVTPIENSLSSVRNYKDAQVLVTDGMGHTTSATQNLCAYTKVATYFQTNALPGNDSFCALETGPFGLILNGTLEENIMQAGLSDLVN
ncbi:putative Peptidase S33 tripeptidyl aminopeptidase-like C-terminal domain-containing protein [Seiridium unicorne]|uniref:Peptidase S33 tripeptidyl aminopeptidase-like C-terminal domain-containing protein n=1 Tax=Seiridium unicorne TaxID=138068 RepID=A0ABR2VI98_9PEZI